MGYYIYSNEKNISLGVKKKILTQAEFFANQLGECIPYPVEERSGKIYKLFKRIPYLPGDISWRRVDGIISSDYIYIRKPLLTFEFVRMLKKLRKKNPNARIVIEVPTYPYDDEMKSAGIGYYPCVLRDQVNRKRLNKYIDYLAVIGRVDDTLWKVPTINFFNGIDLNKVQKRVPDNHRDVIRLVCVANFARYHGIDRLLRGLEKYYKDCSNGPDKSIRNIDVHLVGAGDQISVLHEMVDNSEFLKNHVIFYGPKTPEEISDIYNICDIGIVSLGYERIGLSYNTTIKSKEYLAAGIPFITDTDVDVFGETEYKYCRKVCIQSDMVNVEEIIQFFDELEMDGSIEARAHIAAEMRKYAEENVGYDTALKKVTDRMVKNNG